jgi:predicted permease
VALSALLLVLAGLLVNSLWHVLHVDRGFASGRVVDITVMLPAKYRAVEARAEFFDRAAAALGALPGVRSAAAVSRVPLAGESNVNGVRVDGADASALDPSSRQRVMVNGRFVGNEYFAAMGIPLVYGRAIEAADRDRNVAVISARLAAKIFPGQDPIGHSVTAGSQIDGARIVGVVGDVPATKLEGDPVMMVYAPFWKRAYQVADVVVRTAGNPAAVETAAQAAIRALDWQIPAPKMQTMQELVDRSVAQRRFQMNLATAFAGAALLLAALGIYGVVAYGVSLQRKELGVRMAMGARAGQLRAAVVRKGLRPAAVGVCLGLVAALAAGRLVRTLLFGVAPADALTFASVAALLLGVAVVACLAPAQSAARIDPARVLRDE